MALLFAKFAGEIFTKVCCAFFMFEVAGIVRMLSALVKICLYESMRDWKESYVCKKLRRFLVEFWI
jgi:hypothetical protein